MAVSYRSSSAFPTPGDDTGSPLSVPVPSGAAAGDIALLVAEFNWPTDAVVTWPAGFTEKVNFLNPSELRLKVAWKRLTGSDAGNYSLTYTSTGHFRQGQCILLTGAVATGDPIEVFNTAQADFTNTVPSVAVTTSTSVFLVHFAALYNFRASTPPTSYTRVQDANYLDTSYRIAGATGLQTASGGTSAAGATDHAVALLAVLPDAGGSAHTQTPADDEGLTDTTAFDVGDAEADNEPLTDTAALAQGKVAADNLGLTDSANVARGVGVSAADTFGLTDASTLDRTQAPSEALGLTDAAILTRGIAHPAADNLGLTDTTSQAVGQAQADSLGLTDSVQIQASGAGALAPVDVEGLTDSAALTRSQSSADTEALTDAVVVEPARIRTAADNLGLTDQVSLVIARDLGDTLTLTDTAALTATFVRVLAEAAGLTDAALVELIGPTTGTVIRPYTGTTSRPYTGTTVRPG